MDKKKYRKNNAPLERTKWVAEESPPKKAPKITVKATGPEIRPTAAIWMRK
jgi:hypothetical protein